MLGTGILDICALKFYEIVNTTKKEAQLRSGNLKKSSIAVWKGIVGAPSGLGKGIVGAPSGLGKGIVGAPSGLGKGIGRLG